MRTGLSRVAVMVRYSAAEISRLGIIFKVLFLLQAKEPVGKRLTSFARR